MVVSKEIEGKTMISRLNLMLLRLNFQDNISTASAAWLQQFFQLQGVQSKL